MKRFNKQVGDLVYNVNYFEKRGVKEYGFVYCVGVDYYCVRHASFLWREDEEWFCDESFEKVE